MMQISLDLPWPRIVFFSAVMLLGAGGVLETVRLALVETWTNSSQFRDLERAQAIDPGDPETYYRMGTLNLLGAGTHPSDPVLLLRKATLLNPKLGRYWLALGRACFVARDQVCADQALEHAAKLSPMTPSTQWEVATYDVFTGRFAESFSRLANLLDADPTREDDVFHFTWRAFDPDMTWQHVISAGKDPRVKCDYLAFLSQNDRVDNAETYWKQMVASVRPSFEDAKPYLQSLLQNRKYEEAIGVWTDLLRQGMLTDGSMQPGNLVFNGSFEEPILNAGFDWNTSPAEFVSVNVSGSSAQSGKQSLMIDYTVPNNSDLESAYKLVSVSPNHKYVLSAYTRSEEITSDSGPRLRVQDAECPACLDVMTDMTLGTTGWHQLQVAFSTGPKTAFLRISIWRSRGRTYPMDISGRFWLDSVALSAQDSAVLTEAASARVVSNLR